MSRHSLRVAAVVPTLNEERAVDEYLPAALAAVDQVVVSDGSSQDDTRERAESLGARVVVGAPNRGAQLNRGAAAAEGEILVFLHADTRLPEGAATAMRQAITAGAVGGAFLLRFTEEAEHRLLTVGRLNINFRSRLFKVPLGDQAQFVTREEFEAMGGVEEWPILEDLEFFRRLKRRGPVRIVRRPVITSARRFLRRGPIRTVLLNWLIWGLFYVGVGPARLSRLYRHVR